MYNVDLYNLDWYNVQSRDQSSIFNVMRNGSSKSICILMNI